MSYDIYLRAPPPCEHCGQSPGDTTGPDPTYNLTSIFDLALTGEPLPNPDVNVVILRAETDRPRGLRVLSGCKAKDTLPTLNAALNRLKDPTLRAQFVALEPGNRWGTLEGALSVIEKLRDLATTHLDHTWEIH